MTSIIRQSDKQRHTQSDPCPICGKWDSLNRGKGERCSGATWSHADGRTTVCSVFESSKQADSDGWVHFPEADECFYCGGDHSNGRIAMTRLLPKPDKGYEQPDPWIKQGEPYATCTIKYGGVVYSHMRQDYVHSQTGERTKKVWWNPKPSDQGHNIKEFPFWVPGEYIRNGDETVVIAEGEKAAQAIFETGFPSITGVGGSGVVPSETAIKAVLNSCKRVVLWPDNDAPGTKYMNQLSEAIRQCYPDLPIHMVEIPHTWDQGADAADIAIEQRVELIDASITREALEVSQEPVAQETPPVEPQRFKAKVFEGWNPPLPPDMAYHGIIGEWVQQITKYTDASPAALYIQALTKIIVLAGVGANIGDFKEPRLFVGIVGPSGEARKGWSLNLVDKYLFNPLAKDWRADWQDLTVHGIATGEGLIRLFNTPEPNHTDDFDADVETPGAPIQKIAQTEELDELFVYSGRDGATITSKVRQLYDGGQLDKQVADVQQSVKAKDPRLSIVGHTNQDDLVMRVPTDSHNSGNGVLNRFVVICVNNTNNGVGVSAIDDIAEDEFKDILERLNKVLKSARTEQRIKFTPEAREMLDNMAKRYTKEQGEMNRFTSGFMGRNLNNAVRIAGAMALLDESSYHVGMPNMRSDREIITVEHLIAADKWIDMHKLAPNLIWGADQATKQEERILNFLEARESDGETLVKRTDLYGKQCFNHNISSAQLDIYAKKLVQRGLVEITIDQNPVARDTEYWRRTDKAR